MSLIHTKVATIPDDPGYEVGKDEWNEEHKFPGAGAGEVVFVDSSGHAATSGDFKFDAANKTLHVQLVGGDPTAGLTLYADSDVQQSSLVMIDGAIATDRSVILRAGNNGRFAANVDGTSSVESSFMGITLGNGTGGLQDGATVSGSVFPDQDNNRDLGGLTADLGEDRRFRTGYFGMSVVSPLFTGDLTGNVTGNLSGNVSADPMGSGVVDSASYSVGGNAGQSGTVSGADLVAQSLSFVNGIYMGLV